MNGERPRHASAALLGAPALWSQVNSCVGFSLYVDPYEQGALCSPKAYVIADRRVAISQPRSKGHRPHGVRISVFQSVSATPSSIQCTLIGELIQCPSFYDR
jgi:hypothetical protein